MPVTYSHITTAEGNPLYTIDGYPIVVAIYDALQINCPGNISIVTPINESRTVSFPGLTASGGVPPYTFSYSPASGSLFPVGSTSVLASVTDSLSNVDSCTFTVTISATQASGCTTGLSNEFNI